MLREQFYKKFLEENPYPRSLKSYELSAAETPLTVTHHGHTLINFSSSDYLGLSRHPLLIQRSQEYAERYGVGVSSSRLVTGNSSVIEKCESDLAAALGKPAALIFGAGYQTNFTVLEALLDNKILGQTPLVFADRNVHVSMLSATVHLAELVRFKHNDVTHLKTLLEKHTASEQPKFILIESIYSMDGDTAPLTEIIALAKKYNAMLYVDDAHAGGVYGENGFGKTVAHAESIDVIMGTFSKGMGSFGGYIACSELLRDYLVNKCRGLIYSTGLSPAVLGAISAALEVVPGMTKERNDLQTRASTLRKFLQDAHCDTGASDSHIIPWIIGDADKTLHISELLQQQGILATTIRPPSVAPGQSRIRFCLSSAHSEADIAKLQAAISHSLLLSRDYLFNI
jgi:8-amino-7-oxononanoate synthase